MMWQDGLALFIVAIAALVVLRAYVPMEMFRFGARRSGGSSMKNAASNGGCSGCAAGSSCAKTLLTQARPSVTRQGEQFLSGDH